jgi:hypothetical protein
LATSNYPVPAVVSRYQRNGLIVGAVGLALTLVGLFVSPTQFFHSYMLGYLFFIGLALGSLGLLLLQYLTGGAWGVLTRRIFEAATRSLPVAALLFIPIILGMSQIFPWMTDMKNEAHVVAKSGYLNVPFFIGRAIFYFIFWIFTAAMVNRYARLQEQDGDVRWSRKLENFSGGGFFFFFLVATFMSVDWMMSLAPEWYSTMYAFIIVVAQGINAMTFAIIVVILLAKVEPFASVVKPVHLHDLGKLLFAFNFLWGYLCFCQYLITYSGNLPEETVWYFDRTRGGWEIIAYLVIFAHFILPFVLLLSRDLKRNGRTLIIVASLLFLMRIIDLYWYVEPNWHRSEFFVSWMDVTAIAGFLGLFVFLWAMQYKKRAMLPINEPELAIALHPKGAH